MCILGILSAATQLVFAIENSILGGQALKAVSPHESMSSIVGIVILLLIAFAVCFFGIRVNVIDWAVGGTVADVGALIGLGIAHLKLGKALRARFTAKGNKNAEFVTKHCSSQQKFRMSKLESDTFFKNGTHLLSEPDLSDVFKTLVMGSKHDEASMAPMPMYHALEDETVSIGPARLAAKHWAQFGSNVTFITNTDVLATHSVEELKVISGIVRFVTNRFDDRPFTKELRMHSGHSRRAHQYLKQADSSSAWLCLLQSSFLNSAVSQPLRGLQSRLLATLLLREHGWPVQILSFWSDADFPYKEPRWRDRHQTQPQVDTRRRFKDQARGRNPIGHCLARRLRCAYNRRKARNVTRSISRHPDEPVGDFVLHRVRPLLPPLSVPWNCTQSPASCTRQMPWKTCCLTSRSDRASRDSGSS